MGLIQKYGAQDYFPAMKELGIEIWASEGTPTESGPAKGALAVDKTNGKLYINQGTASSATWVLIEALGSTIGTSEIEDNAITTTKINAGAVTGSKLSNAANTRIAPTNIGGIANGGQNDHIFAAGAACVIDNVIIVSDTATTGSDGANNYEFQVVNLTQTQNLLATAVSTNSNEIAADATFQITPDQNATIAQGDVLELQITENGIATDLTGAKVTAYVVWSVTA